MTEGFDLNALLGDISIVIALVVWLRLTIDEKVQLMQENRELNQLLREEIRQANSQVNEEILR